MARIHVKKIDGQLGVAKSKPRSIDGMPCLFRGGYNKLPPRLCLGFGDAAVDDSDSMSCAIVASHCQKVLRHGAIQSTMLSTPRRGAANVRTQLSRTSGYDSPLFNNARNGRARSGRQGHSGRWKRQEERKRGIYGQRLQQEEIIAGSHFLLQF